MANLTFKGSYKSGEPIPEPTSVIYGKNLKKTVKEKPPEKEQVEEPTEKPRQDYFDKETIQ